MFNNCKKLFNVIILIFFLLILILIKLFLTNVQLNKALLNVNKLLLESNKSLVELKKPKAGKVIYKDKSNNFGIYIPYGWEIISSENWNSINPVGSSYGINMNYYSKDWMEQNKTLLGKWYREKNESLYQAVLRIVEDTYNNEVISNKNAIKPSVKEYTYAGRSAVVVDCEHMTLIGGGGACTKTGYNDQLVSGDPFLRNLYIDDNKGGYLRLDINGERTSQTYDVDLTEWIDRITFSSF